MSSFGYKTEKRIDQIKLSYFFESIGESTITKVIEYEYIQDLPSGRKVYNLGFGDYDERTDTFKENGYLQRVFKKEH